MGRDTFFPGYQGPDWEQILMEGHYVGAVITDIQTLFDGEWATDDGLVMLGMVPGGKALGHLSKLGKYADESIPARSAAQKFLTSERAKINEIGSNRLEADATVAARLTLEPRVGTSYPTISRRMLSIPPEVHSGCIRIV